MGGLISWGNKKIFEGKILRTQETQYNHIRGLSSHLYWSPWRYDRSGEDQDIDYRT